MNLLENKQYKEDIESALANYDFRQLQNKTVLITGGTGLICSTIVDALICLNDKGLNINILVAGRDISKINERFSKKVYAIHYDALSPVNLIDFSIDYIIHGAGIATPNLYTSLPVETMLSHILSVNNLLEYCVGKNTRLLYISSSEVYGKIQKNDPLLEDDYGYVDIDNVRNSYVESKRASEVLCRAYINEHEVNVLFARPGHVYGPTASIKDKRVSSDFAYKAAKGEKLELLSSGLQKRSYLYCVDAAMALLVCVTNGSIGEAYNIGSKEITTVRQMAEIYAKIGNCKLIVKNPNKNEIKNFNPMNNSTLNSSKLENLGYKECFTPIIGLSHTVEIIKDEYEL